MVPVAGKPYAELDRLTGPLAAAGGSGSDLVGLQAFGSSSAMDDMAHAAVWLAVATGERLWGC
jgi:hypothetical protein